MSGKHFENRNPLQDEPAGSSKRTSASDYEDWPERRAGKDRRSAQNRRKKQEPIDFQDRRSGEDRREGQRRKKTRRVPIFIKLAILSTLLIFFVIFTISFSMLQQQRKQFIGQLIDLGESLTRIVSYNARDKLLGEEDLALFQLMDDVAQNEQVLYALVVDHKDIIRAHSRIEELNKTYSAPKNIRVVRRGNDVITGVIVHNAEETLFFENSISYQELMVGKVYLAISQEKVFESIGEAKRFIWFLTAVITLSGILLSLVLSMYFSHPIRRLGEGAKALGIGHLSHRVHIKRNDELGDLAYAFNGMAEDLEVKEKIKDSFGRYVAPEIVETVLANPDRKWLKASKVEVTVLFVDIRGFTSLSENEDPESIVELLNDYFTLVTDAVIKYGGHVNKFWGDEVMAVFGTPLPNPKHAQSAVRSALDIQEDVSRLNREHRGAFENIFIGVGINSGEMVAGNLGSQKRMEFTVIGDDVNVASRLTSHAKAGEILISSSTYDLIRKNTSFLIEEIGKVAVKGRKEEVGVFNVIAFEEEEYHHEKQRKT
jgi:adenylate cyclase